MGSSSPWVIRRDIELTTFAIQHARARLGSTPGNAVTVDRQALEALVRAAEAATPGTAEMDEFQAVREKSVARVKKQRADG